jgi:hypothetical protein
MATEVIKGKKAILNKVVDLSRNGDISEIQLGILQTILDELGLLDDETEMTITEEPGGRNFNLAIKEHTVSVFSKSK